MKDSIAKDPSLLASQPSVPLLAAALAGLLAGVGGCSGTDGDAAHDHLGAEATSGVVLSTVEDKTMTYAKFTDECNRRGGLVQTHAVCFGNNSCKGMSYNKYDYMLTEHSCKALNSCGGMSCVVLPKDQGRTGEAIYQGKESCSGCHGAEEFHLPVPPGTDIAKATADFPSRSPQYLTPIVAFGVRGYSQNGVAQAFMPAHHEKYSVAEIERTLAYLKTLPLVVEEYGILGVTEDVKVE